MGKKSPLIHWIKTKEIHTYIHTYIYIYIYNTHIYINTYTHNQHSLECSTVLSLFRNAKTDTLQVQQQQEQHYKFTTICKLITAKMNYENKKV